MQLARFCLALALALAFAPAHALLIRADRDDAEYLELLAQHLPEILERHHPDLLFYLAGADPYRFDQLGGLGLSLEGLRRRDELVFERAASEGIAVAVCLAGGYALDSDDTVEIHCNTVRAARAFRRPAA